MVYDRAYGSQVIPFLHRHFGSNCVVRLRADFSNTVKNFVKAAKTNKSSPLRPHHAAKGSA
jgi:hypothetical protein